MKNRVKQAKAAGAVKRLDAEGKPIELQGPNIATGQPFLRASAEAAVAALFAASRPIDGPMGIA